MMQKSKHGAAMLGLPISEDSAPSTRPAKPGAAANGAGLVSLLILGLLVAAAMPAALPSGAREQCKHQQKLAPGIPRCAGERGHVPHQTPPMLVGFLLGIALVTALLGAGLAWLGLESQSTQSVVEATTASSTPRADALKVVQRLRQAQP
jgi:hypothetical protein